MKRLNLPENVLNIILSANSKGTRDQYNIYIKRWIKFCSENRLSTWSPTLKDVLLFLTQMYECGMGYSSINTAKSALSSVLNKYDGVPLGQNPIISKFMKGIFKLRPPTARYNVTWDACKVLNVFEIWKDNNQLSLHDLTLKLIGLLALTTAQRVQTLSQIRLDNIVWEEPVQIIIRSHLKCTTIRKPNTVLVIPTYHHNPKLCVVQVLKQYLSVTRILRGNNNELFISYINPHSSVTSQTLSRWLTDVLKLAGIDTTIYHGHSFRHSATSKAVRNGLSVDSILERVGWSERSRTFAKFYNRPIDVRGEFLMNFLKQN